ncbi:MAG: class II aldolase/adducin family protein [Thermodesulfobacteriota bacterium]|nr:class II aldolase/adducin family protein [Thermodesulfobacteriota bacterium]
MLNKELRNKLELAHRILHMEGLAEDASRGHITAKSEDGRIYIKPWGMGFEDVTARDFQGLDLKGNLLEGKGRVHSELILHLEIYRKRSDVFSIAHVHPFHSILLSAVFKGRIHILNWHGVRFAGKIPFYRSAELIQSRPQAKKLTQTLGKGPLVLMKNHGITAVGKTIEEAAILSLFFEKAAKDHLLATTFGKPSGMPVAIAEKLSAHSYSPAQYQMLWDYYCKKFKRKKNTEKED